MDRLEDSILRVSPTVYNDAWNETPVRLIDRPPRTSPSLPPPPLASNSSARPNMLVQERAKRASAGNRMHELLAQEDFASEEVFLEAENDADFEEREGMFCTWI